MSDGFSTKNWRKRIERRVKKKLRDKECECVRDDKCNENVVKKRSERRKKSDRQRVVRFRMFYCFDAISQATHVDSRMHKMAALKTQLNSTAIRFEQSASISSTFVCIRIVCSGLWCFVRIRNGFYVASIVVVGHTCMRSLHTSSPS